MDSNACVVEFGNFPEPRMWSSSTSFLSVLLYVICILCVLPFIVINDTEYNTPRRRAAARRFCHVVVYIFYLSYNQNQNPIFYRLGYKIVYASTRVGNEGGKLQVKVAVNWIENCTNLYMEWMRNIHTDMDKAWSIIIITKLHSKFKLQ